MNIRPSLDEIKKIASAGEYCSLPVSCEILSDIRTPIEVLKVLKNVSSRAYLLESASQTDTWGRYTFLGYDPKMGISCRDSHMTVGELTFETQDPGKYIRQVIEANKMPRFDDLPTFTGGLVGYFSYDYQKYAEPSLHLTAQDTEGFQDVDLMLFDKVIAFDNYRQKIVLMVDIKIGSVDKTEGAVNKVNPLDETKILAEYNRAIRELEDLARLIREGEPAKDQPGRITSEVKALFDKEQYCRMVEEGKRHIYEGDIFQIVLSNRLEADFEGSLLNTYRMLRTVNPSPYMFYFCGADMEAAGASPETLVKLENGVLHTFPLAGTRPRGKTPQEDKALEKELLADPKELAEHSMLVDLGRNDLGKISKFGSVQVESSYEVLRYSHVMHIGSTVRGEIDEVHDGLDAVDAVLPAGTLSGAPKIMACKLINELEDNKRGIYGGAFGYLSFTGDLDLCIGIRLAYAKNGKVFVRSGAGIVADSVPETEYQECLNKAAAVIRSLQMAEEVDT